ncbi:CDP-diacylglycerol--glycerol-3-phosphate 3-phosphatidyltransferase [Actinoplanes lutulentus]|uniref:CDP-diacylglycerol--glycerol-3-phosphate 3-phosphatidyltransferase n=1 Tax=Actinoplanes lutulentus TaxID=1287878 RepID=A0A327Z437_9ACTN|nr:CDP-alcohol phosphatidyltransferase family protein [Actinoplanes lutulentus]MBB2947745.1 CDP-diacylglycerol--glycerol-3-phosphate 3-phosphatidyltransferase [Actinoplanes lutulentus]RAK29941.1 CDP-diacylglycerol--glycerol-3-phosphate 3-phosphatidyltransferase [Actinoplanes lutulentus]
MTTLVTIPNTITSVRTIASIGLAMAALTHRSVSLLVAAYLTYWIGDILDGTAARALGQETRTGAVFDIVADRACTSACAAALVVLQPATVWPIAVFLIQFMVIDQLLSLMFLRWPLLSPNYFAQVDRRVYWWNWSPPAKALNTAAVVILAIAAPVAVAVTFALAVTAVKVASLIHTARLPVGSPAVPTACLPAGLPLARP